MLSFGCGLQQVCPQSLVLPSLDLTRLLELLLDLQLLRLCSGWTEGRWGQGRRERGGGDRSRDRERERNRKHVRQRGRGELYTDRDGNVLRDQEDSRWARDAKKIKVSKSTFERNRSVHGQGTENL